MADEKTEARKPRLVRAASEGAMATSRLPRLADQVNEMLTLVQSPFLVAHRNQFIHQFTEADEGAGVRCCNFW